MTDPLTILMASYTALKTGVKLGKDASALWKDVNSLFDSVDQIRENHERKKNSIFTRGDESDLDTYMALTKAKDIEEELRGIILATRGYSGWQEFVKVRAEGKKRRQREREEKRKRHLIFMRNLGYFIGAVLFCGGTVLMIWGASKFAR